MQLKLSRSGGLVGKRMTGEIQVDISNEEWTRLSSAIKIERPDPDKRKKDAFNYSIEIIGNEDSKIAFNPNRVPEQYHKLFKSLFDALKPEDK